MHINPPLALRIVWKSWEVPVTEVATVAENILIMSSHTAVRLLFLGSFIHSKSLEELEFSHDTAICVDEKGVIVAIESGFDQNKAEEVLFPKLGWTKGEVAVKVAKPGQFFFPGFIGPSTPCSIPSSH